MKELNIYSNLTDEELVATEGGGVGVAIALFMAGYTIGRDIAKRGK